jgi:hypothetical protein
VSEWALSHARALHGSLASAYASCCKEEGWRLRSLPSQMGALEGGRSQRRNRLPLKKEVVPMRRILTVVAVALVMAALLLAMAMPAFAAKPFLIGSAVSPQNVEEEEGEGPHNGFNYGHCALGDRDVDAPGNGRTTAVWNPSFHGGNDELSEASATCTKI